MSERIRPEAWTWIGVAVILLAVTLMVLAAWYGGDWIRTRRATPVKLEGLPRYHNLPVVEGSTCPPGATCVSDHGTLYIYPEGTTR